MVYYYRLQNRIVYQNQEADGSWSFCVKQPLFMKNYVYQKLSFSPDGSECFVQTWEPVSESTPVELKDVQKQTVDWFKEINKGQESVLHQIAVDDEGNPVIKVELPLDIKSFDTKKVKKEMEELKERVSRG